MPCAHISRSTNRRNNVIKCWPSLLRGNQSFRIFLETPLERRREREREQARIHTIKLNKKTKQVFEVGFYVFMFTSLLPSWQPQRNFIVCSIRQRRTSAHLCSSRTSIAFHIVFSWFFFSFRQTIFPKATVILWPFTLGLLRVKYSSGRLCLDDWPIYAENDLIERSEKKNTIESTPIYGPEFPLERSAAQRK